MELRKYQQDAIDALFAYWETGKGKNPLIVMPTGSGKSLIIAEFCKQICTESPHIRISCVTDSRELIAQNEKELRKHYEDASTGVYSAGLGRRQTQAQITFAGIQSVYTQASIFGKQDIILVDEAHMIGKESQTRYGRFMNEMKALNPDVVVVGLTATPYRLDSGVLHEGEGALFDGIAHCTDLKQLIKAEYLVPVISKGGVKKIDLAKVRILAGEYNSGELAHAADDPELIRLAVEEIVKYGKDRKAWLIYAAGVDHANHVAEEVRKHGINCKVVTGDTETEERDRIIGGFRDGKIRCVVNVGVLTKGFNAPVCDLIALLMATQSTGKYVQIVGRGLRTFPDKKNCLLLDYGGNVMRHGTIDEVDPVKKKNIFCIAPSAPPMKECPDCGTIWHLRTTICPYCGYEFPVKAPHGTEAYEGDVLSDASKKMAVLVNIAGVWYSRHKKPGRPDSVKVTFYTEMDKEYYLWLALDHGGFATEKALSVVKQFGGTAKTVNEALKECDFWRKPIAIMVKPDGKFFRIMGVKFDETKVHTRQSELGA
jgi:DNA repair protein RadD